MGDESGAARRARTCRAGTFNDLRVRSRALEQVALFGDRNMLVSNGEQTWEAHAAAVSPELFDMLGIRPLLGNGFTPGDAAGARDDQVVISHRMWREYFGGAADIIGRTIRMDYRWSYVVVGVMPAGFDFPQQADIWTPLVYSRALSPGERQLRYYGAIGRLRPGHTIAAAATEASAIAAQLETEYPASNAGWGIELAPLDRSILGNARPALLVLLGLACCVLLITCGNVATLAVARAAARGHETAVRVALGASTRRLLGQWMAEGALLAALGGAGGLLVGYWSSRLLLAVAPADIPRLDEVAFGAPVVLFTILITCAAALAVGLAPAFRPRRAGLTEAVRNRAGGGSHRSARTREWLVGVQIALTFVLTVAAALLLRSFERLRGTELGYRQSDVLSAELRVPGGRFPGAGAGSQWLRRLQYYDGLIAELGRVPGVHSVAGTTNVPLTGDVGSGSMWRTDAPGAHDRTPPTSAADQWRAGIQIVTPAYFETLGIPVVRGRAFAAADRFSDGALTDLDAVRPPGVAIINEAMAQRFWPNADPIGTRLFLFDDESFSAYRTIVGVVRNARVEAVSAAASPTIFLPFAQSPGRGLSLVVRSDLPAEEMVGPVATWLHAFDKDLSVSRVRALDTVVGGALSRPRFTMLLAASFAVLALLVAAVGVFGIVGFLVARRTHEIGIRVALGARSTNVVGLVLREGLRPVVIGVVAGGAGAVLVARAMQATLYGIAPLDVVSFAASAAVLLVTSVAAAALPAGRAVGVDPLRALRAE